MPPHGSRSPLLERDARQLEARGLSLAEAKRQLELLRHPPPPPDLVRPCTPGDGIERLEASRLKGLAERHERAASRGELCAFVPASGAASRMFRDLMIYRRDSRGLVRAEIEADRAAGKPEASALLEFAGGLDRFAFREVLDRALAARGERLSRLVPNGPYQPVLAALLDPDGLHYGSMPKALIPFHRYPVARRTAFEEHLSEATALLRDAGGRTRLHLTTPPERVGSFRATLERAQAHDRGLKGATVDVAFSIQDPATDALALDTAGEPTRNPDGSLVLRPSGHGALIGNLASVQSPIAFIKNIDNVVAEPHRGPTETWTRALVGRLCELRDRIHGLLVRLDDARDGAAVEEAAALLRDELGEPVDDPGLDAAARRAEMIARLDRPLRVCGMVPNTGEPGGGPFWVRGREGRVTKQIVESAQVPPDDLAGRAVFQGATHFNPVFLAVSLDDRRGRRRDLAAFVDPDAVFLARRSTEGRELLALERPGLWNGGMARWSTVFVEVPLAVFNPVKTVNDLLRPEHQGE